ncbi:MAG: MMPL family transporter [Candidatus Thermoplasmatota archaeon]|nr:MMPL family transporter [Candidatus Thermoplasmatota archaeon]
MSLLGRYENWIARKPLASLAVILALTLVMSYFAIGISFDAGEESFIPENDIAIANARVRDNYGSQINSALVLFLSENNILSQDVLLTQLGLEERILDSGIREELVSTPTAPNGISSPATTIAQAAMFQMAMALAENFSQTPVDNSSAPHTFSAEQAQAEFSSILLSLTTDQKRTIVEGGNVTISLSFFPFPVNLTFPPYSPEMLPSYLEGSPFENAIMFQVSTDYSEGGTTATKSILSLSLSEDIASEKALELQEQLASLAKVVDEQNPDLELRAYGDQLTSKEISRSVGASIGILMTLAFTLVIVVLFFISRSGSDTLYTLLALGIAIIWVFGFIVLFDYPFSPNLTTVPVLIIGLGIDYGIHFNLRYREEIRRGKNIEEAYRRTGASVGFAILLATLTTVVGFMSNVSSDISAVRNFGILSAIGIVSSFVLMLTFFPAAKAIADKRKLAKGKPLLKEKKTKDEGWGWAKKKMEQQPDRPSMVCASGSPGVNRVLGFGAVVAQKPAAVFLVVGLITLAGVYGVMQQETKYDFRDFLPANLEVTETTNILLNDFQFSQGETVLILVEGNVASVNVFDELRSVRQHLLQSQYVVLSEPLETPADLGMRLSNPTSYSYNESFAQFWYANIDMDMDGEPDWGHFGEPTIIAMYDALFEHAPEQASRVLHKTESRYDGVVFRIPVNTQSGQVAAQVSQEMETIILGLKQLEYAGILDTVVVTGGPIIGYYIFSSISESQGASFFLTFIAALVILTGLYVFLKRSLVLGLVTMAPLVFVITWTLGSMYYLGIPLNVVTATIAAITVGLGIDYSIHLTQRFLEDIEKLKDVDCTLCVSVNHTGSALFGSAATTMIGFAIIGLSAIPPLSQFGMVTALSVLFSFLAAVFVLPTLLRLWFKGSLWMLKKRGKPIPETRGECLLPDEDW